LPLIADLNGSPKLLLDTTVYIDQLQGRFPLGLDLNLNAAKIWHSTVTECEMAALAGLLDPAHPGSASVVDQVLASIGQRPENRIVNPGRETWRDAGILSGTLARLQQYGKADQRRVLNDALILLSAAKEGLTVLTRNIADYDLLMQLAPHAKAVFYEL
jgi:predicted nucleic acid-binding protein